jgi:polar amino acid transport system permease protein
MSFQWEVFWEALTSSTLLNGAALTVALTASSFAAASVLGLPLALARASSARILRVASWLYIWVWRGTPTLLQLLFVWNALPQLVPSLQSSWFTPFVAAFITLALTEAAYMAEIIRSGLGSVDSGQRLAARALGMSSRRILVRITLPQAIRVMLPPAGNELITLLKLTSLTSVISLRELLTVTSQGVSSTFSFAELYAAAAIYYLILTSLLTIVQSWTERRFVWGTRALKTSRQPVLLEARG